MYARISRTIVVIASIVATTGCATRQKTVERDPGPWLGARAVAEASVAEVTEAPLVLGLMVSPGGSGDKAGPKVVLQVGDGNKSLDFLVDQSSDVPVPIGSIVGDHAVRIWGTQKGTDVLSGLINAITQSGAASKHLLDLPLKVTVSPVVGRTADAVAVFHEEGEEDREFLLLYAGGNNSERNEADGLRVFTLIAVQSTSCSASPPGHTCSCSASGPGHSCSWGTTTDGTAWAKCTDDDGTTSCTGKGGTCHCESL